MPDRAARAALVLALATCLISTAFAAEDSIEGVWLGVSSQIGSVYRLELEPDGTGKLQYVSHVGEQPELRSYAVRSWSLDEVRIDLELEPLEGAPRLLLRGKLAATLRRSSSAR